MTSSWIEGRWRRTDGFPRPDWPAVTRAVMAAVPENGRDAAFAEAAREWVVELADSLGGSFHAYESERFLLVTHRPEEVARRMLAFLEETLTRLVERVLPGIAERGGYGKHVLLHFRDSESYHAYVAHFDPDAMHQAVSIGRFLFAAHEEDAGYGHIATYGSDVRIVEHTIAHELAHNLVMHLPLPSWLNEGIASTAEAIVTHGRLSSLSDEEVAEHRSAWGGGGIQEFWRGASVCAPDDRSGLTYHLAELLVRMLARDRDRFVRFVTSASWDDAGEAAALAVYGSSLGKLVECFLGPGDWSPMPESWALEGLDDAVDAPRST